MAIIRRQADVDLPRSDVEAAWTYFAHWIVMGKAKMACDELVCVDAVRSGLIRFEEAGRRRTSVIFELDAPDDTSLPVEEIERLVAKDLSAFKEYVEHDHLQKRNGHKAGSGQDVRDSSLDPGQSAMFWHR